MPELNHTHSRVINSDAFNRATLHSERYRIAGVMVMLVALCFLGLGRVIVMPHDGDLSRIVIGLGFMAVVIGVEWVVLVLVNRAIRSGQLLNNGLRILDTVLESTIPTFMLLGISSDREFIGPYRALYSPIVLLYCAFVILSSLRLKPVLCVLSGLVSSAGYVLVYLITRRVVPESPYRTNVPVEAYFMFPIVLFGLGLVAAAVARRIRKHVVAALNEAESQRKLGLIEHDLQLARSIQMDLLPQAPPIVKGYDIAGWTQPADQTGGDYYDWLELPGNRVLFTIADATGHGIGPALMIAACRAYFRAIVIHDDPLEKIAEQVDALVAADSSGGRFVTAAIAILEPDLNRINLYSAGQAPIYFYTASDHRVQTFEADQPPLGINFGSSGMHARQLPLNPGDALVLITDGFFECRNPSDQILGIERLGELIRGAHQQSSSEMIQTLKNAVVAHCQGKSAGDDLTAVIIKRA